MRPVFVVLLLFSQIVIIFLCREIWIHGRSLSIVVVGHMTL